MKALIYQMSKNGDFIIETCMIRQVVNVKVIFINYMYKLYYVKKCRVFFRAIQILMTLQINI